MWNETEETDIIPLETFNNLRLNLYFIDIGDVDPRKHLTFHKSVYTTRIMPLFRPS